MKFCSQFATRICSVAVLTVFLILPQLEAQSSAKPDADYYATAYKLYGPALRTELHNIIKGHTSLGYDGLYTAYPTTDIKPNGKMWDIYSDVPNGTPAYEFTYGTKKCGSYNSEGDCYNREHSWCDSWLGAQATARADLFHMYPTDGYVNNRRSNYPYGTVASPTWTSTNGSKLGPNTYPGYSGTVFEVINAYKGDVARSAMYMSCRYYTEDGSWIATPATNKSEILPWYANMLYDWSIQDTVSKKEIDRNNAIYTFQHNRNPFIDHPEFAAEIWKTTMAPSVVYVKNLNSTTTLIDFSRYLDSTVSVTKANFVFDNGIGSPVQVIWGVNNDVSKLQLITSALVSGTHYTLQIKNLKSINSIAMRDTSITINLGGTTYVQNVTGAIPGSFELEQNYPNPFNPTTNIKFALKERSNTTLTIYNQLGQKVAVPVNEVMEAGYHSITWNASSQPSGVYFYELRTENYSSVKKLVVMK